MVSALTFIDHVYPFFIGTIAMLRKTRFFAKYTLKFEQSVYVFVCFVLFFSRQK